MAYQIAKDKKSPNIFYVKDGYFKHKVTIGSTNTCNCETKKCTHIDSVLTSMYKVEPNVLNFLDISDVKKLFGDLVSTHNPELNLFLQTAIYDYFNNNTCGVCLNKLNTQEVSKCQQCKQYTHKKCQRGWKNICIYCTKPLTATR
jgi:hypothetical protein